jgi:preprotein translocase subunit SecD
MNNAKKVFTNARVIILLVVLLFAVIAINPNPFNKGVSIRSVDIDSSASLAGIESPKPTSSPMSKERIISMNNKPINNINDFYSFESSLKVNRTVIVKTNKGTYRLTTKYRTEEITINETTNETITRVYNDTIDLGLNVYNAPTTNIRKGLDLQGGTRVLLEPERQATNEEMDIVLASIKERLNVYGLSDVVVRPVSDLSGKQYILIEIAGANEEEVKDLVSKQGKFEAKIGNNTIFRGGNDITYVCRSADCSGIDPNTGCGQSNGQWACRFRFSISLSPEAAERQAEITKDLEVVIEDSNQEYLNESLDLYLDNQNVDSLRIGSELKGSAVTDIQISGSGVGPTRQEAMYNSLESMKRLQTVLVTGSLPVKLDIVKTDTISPSLGKEFVRNAFLIGALAVIAVSLIIFIRYRKIEISLPMILSLVSEVIIILGVAALIGWNIDIAAIAGIIIVVGTGVDHLVVISDELLRKEQQVFFNWKQRIKNAFFIIMAAYFTTLVAMLPLMRAGAGLLKGFAITTIIGISVGVFITRPAFASIVEILLKDKL